MCSHWLNRNVTEDDLRKPGILREMLKAPGTVKIIHKTSATSGKTYANIDQFTEVDRDDWDRVPPPSEKQIMLGLSPQFFDRAVFDGLPDWLKKAILKSPEGRQAVEGGGRRDDTYEDRSGDDRRGRDDGREHRRGDRDDRGMRDDGRRRDDRSYEPERDERRDDRRRYDQRMEDREDSGRRQEARDDAWAREERGRQDHPREDRPRGDGLDDDREFLASGARSREEAPPRPHPGRDSISTRAAEARQSRPRDYDPDLDGRDATF